MTHPFFAFFSQNRQTPQRYLYNPGISRVKKYPGAKVIVLPKPAEITNSFSELIGKRISEEDFENTTILMQDLSTILYWSVAEIGERRDGKGHQDTKIQRPHPSGGGKYPLEHYVMIAESHDVARGFYHYRPDTHELELVNILTIAETIEIKKGFGYAFSKNIAAIIYTSFLLERSMPRYGSLAFKLGMIEAGHIGQNFQLAATACDVLSTALGGFKEDLPHTLLGLDGYNETLFYATGLGKKIN